MTGAGQLAGQRLGTQAGALGQLSGQQLQALQAAGQLGLGGQQANVEAMLAALTGGGQLGQQRLATQAGALGQFGQLGQGAAGQQLQALQALLGGQQGDQAARMQALQAAGGMGQQSIQSLISALTQGGQLGMAQTGQGADILSQLLGAQQGAAGTLGQQTIAGQNILAQLFGGQQQNALQAALGLPGATAQIAGLPLNFAQQAFNLGEGGRSVQDQILARMYQDFTRQQGLLPNVFSFLGGTQTGQQLPSPWQTGTGAIGDIMKIITGTKGM